MRPGGEEAICIRREVERCSGGSLEGGRGQVMSPNNDLCSWGKRSGTVSRPKRRPQCVSHLQHGAGVRVGEAGRLVEPQNQVPARQTRAPRLRPPAAPLGGSRFLPGLSPKAEQALVVESIRSFEGKKKG